MKDSKEIINSLNRLEDSWRQYIFRHSFFKNHFNFIEEVQEDIPGVVFGYLQDTLPIILNYHNNHKSDKLNEHFFFSIGFLQTLYVHQDLINELNKAFGFTHSNKNQKSRTLRNELIGHPISRTKKTNHLDSLCLFGYDTNLSQISYLRYAKENNFKFESKQYSTKTLILEHIDFLKKSFVLIQKKINDSFREFTKELLNFLDTFDKTQFNDIIEFIDHNYNDFYYQDYVFKKEIIKKCYEKVNVHSRYDYNINLFKRELLSSIKEDINNINKNFLWNRNKQIVTESKSLDSNYALGKLLSENPIHRIEYFENLFKKDAMIMTELNHMKINLKNKFEYQVSYNYLKYLLNKNHSEFLR